MRGTCEVHDRTTTGGDKTPREVAYCRVCGVYMCDDCRSDPVRRAKAMLQKYAPWARKAA